jgi:2-hydroxychromene-2-carboxylate isomerase
VIIDIYIDFKSPYAFLAIEPSIIFAKKNKLDINWLPYVLDIPEYLGSAKVDNEGNVLESNRNAHQWRRVKYSYMDCRRYANTRNLTIKGPQKIWDTQLVSIALLWTKNNNFKQTVVFINYIFNIFWKRDLDVENYDAIINALKIVNVKTEGFRTWSENEGKKELDLVMKKAHEKGIFGVPSYYINNELFWGREHLPLIKARLTENYEELL